MWLGDGLFFGGRKQEDDSNAVPSGRGLLENLTIYKWRVHLDSIFWRIFEGRCDFIDDVRGMARSEPWVRSLSSGVWGSKEALNRPCHESTDWSSGLCGVCGSSIFRSRPRPGPRRCSGEFRVWPGGWSSVCGETTNHRREVWSCRTIHRKLGLD